MKDKKITYEKHQKVLGMIATAQGNEKYVREMANEATKFVTIPDGQWDDYAVQKMENRFRGTFDMTSPIVDQITSNMESADFGIKISSTGAGSDDNAEILEGMIRNIRNISNSTYVFAKAGRGLVRSGYDGWEVVQDWIDADAFDQDLFIRRVPDFINSVWFDQSSTMQDRSDANWVVKLTKMPLENYEEQFPDGKGQSIGEDRHISEVNQSSSVTIGQLYYRKPTKIDIVRMTNGAVYKDDEDFKAIQDELENPKDGREPITIEKDAEGNEKRRTRDGWRVYSRVLDGGGWLTKPEKTVFDSLPIIPVYGDFDVVENKLFFAGKVQRLMDAQRTLNYSMSSDVESGALAPAQTTWMTDGQAEGNDYSKMNIDRAPVRIYNHEDNVPPPFQAGGAQINQGLQATIGLSKQMINESAGVFSANLGDNPRIQSGVALDTQVNQGDNQAVKWFKSLEMGICQTAKVLISAIPRVYDSTRQVRILKEDGTNEIKVLNEPVFDQQSQKVITLNDLSIGNYDAVCEAGATFKTRQKETAAGFAEIAALDPTIMETARDVWLKNIDAPGMSIVADRARALMLDQGVIPQDQWTDEEIQQFQERQQQQQQEPPQEDPNVILAKTVMIKEQALMLTAQNDQQKLELEKIKLQQSQQKIELDVQKAQFDASNKDGTQSISAAEAQADIKTKEARAARDFAEAEQTSVETESLKLGVTNLMKRIQAGRLDV